MVKCHCRRYCDIWDPAAIQSAPRELDNGESVMTEVQCQCKCGAVRLSVAGELRGPVNCHCQLCRSMNGSAFSSYAIVPSPAVSFIQGKAEIATYPVTKNAVKAFCQRCGTPLFNTNQIYTGLTMIYLGVIDGHTSLIPKSNIHCSSKLTWVDELATAKTFAHA